MDYYKSVQNFLENKKEKGNLYESSSVIYKGKLNVLGEFLESQGLNKLNCESILTGMNKEVVIESLKYYIDSRNIQCVTSASCYYSALKEYFKYLSCREKVTNSTFTTVQEIEELDREITDVIKAKKLKFNEDQKSPITKNIFLKINSRCNQILDEISVNEIVDFDKRNNDPYADFLSALIVKLVMFLGIKPGLLSRFSYSDVRQSTNEILVNGYKIHMPDKLCIHFKKYFEIIDKLGIRNEKYLFIFRNGESVGTNYSKIFSVLHDIIGTRESESIAKYTIIQMIKEDISSNMILNLTGFGIDTYSHCQDLVSSEKRSYDKIRLLDSKMRGLKIFDIL